MTAGILGMGKDRQEAEVAASEKNAMRHERYTRTTVPGLGESVTSTWRSSKLRQSEAVCALMPPAGAREAETVVASATKD